MHCRFVRNSGRLYAPIISVEKHGDFRRGREHRAVGQLGASTSRFGSGKGIDPEVMPPLFYAFFTTKSRLREPRPSIPICFWVTMSLTSIPIGPHHCLY